MVYFIYNIEKNNTTNHITCLSIVEQNGKIVKSKVIEEDFNKNENTNTKWSWSDLSQPNHYIYDNSNSENIPENIFFLAQTIFNKKEETNSDYPIINTTTIDLIEKYKHLEPQDSAIKVEIEKNIIMFKAFLYFTENPDKVFEFPLFKELKNRSGNELYSIEDWLCDMEELCLKD